MYPRGYSEDLTLNTSFPIPKMKGGKKKKRKNRSLPKNKKSPQ